MPTTAVPNPTVIDAAHRNGVKVYGTVFFPPTVFGGKIQWVHDFVRRSGSTYPVADKLVQVAEHYGFDGWFINQETEGGDAGLATELRSLITYARGRGSAEFMWYDAMTESGAISWQEALTSANDAFLNDPARVADSMFLDFGWTAAKLASSRDLARSLGRDEHELYAGIDTEANGIGTGVPWDAVFPPGRPHAASLGIYRPEWTWKASSGLATASGQCAAAEGPARAVNGSVSGGTPPGSPHARPGAPDRRGPRDGSRGPQGEVSELLLAKIGTYKHGQQRNTALYFH
jgi:mannosyl-glycoprotein endo-beta-N-acetylglucosaminidase